MTVSHVTKIRHHASQRAGKSGSVGPGPKRRVHSTCPQPLSFLETTLRNKQHRKSCWRRERCCGEISSSPAVGDSAALGSKLVITVPRLQAVFCPQVCRPDPFGAPPSSRCLFCYPTIHACSKGIDDLRALRWLSTCLSSRTAFLKRHTKVNHTVRTLALEAPFTSTLEVPALDPSPHESSPGLRTGQLIYAIENRPVVLVNVAITCPTASIVFAEKQLCCGTAAHMESRQKQRKRATAARRQSGVVSPVCDPSEFTPPNPPHTRAMRNQLLKEISEVQWRLPGGGPLTCPTTPPFLPPSST